MLRKTKSDLLRKNLKVLILGIFLLSTLLNVFALDKVSDFSLENMKGKKMKLSDFQKDGLVIIDFWATWCSPCKKALPKLNKIHNSYKDVTVLTICTDKPRKKENAKSFVKSNRYNFPVLFDSNRDLQKKMNVFVLSDTLEEADLKKALPGGKVITPWEKLLDIVKILNIIRKIGYCCCCAL